MIGKHRTSDARRDFALIVEEVGACPQRAMIHTLPAIQDGWDSMATLEECQWFTTVFLDSPQENGRLWRAVGSVRKSFKRLAKLHYDTTGEVVELDEVLIEFIARGVMHAMYPSNYEVAAGSKRHSMEKASAAIARLIPEERWHKKYSS